MKIMGIIPARFANEAHRIAIRDTTIVGATGWLNCDRQFTTFTNEAQFTNYIDSLVRGHGVQRIVVDGGSPLGPVLYEDLRQHFKAQASNDPLVMLIGSTHAALGLTYQGADTRRGVDVDPLNPPLPSGPPYVPEPGEVNYVERFGARLVVPGWEGAPPRAKIEYPRDLADVIDRQQRELLEAINYCKEDGLDLARLRGDVVIEIGRTLGQLSLLAKLLRE